MDGLKNLIFISYKNTWNLQKSLGSLIKWIYNFGAHLLLLYKKEKYQCEELVKELKTEPPTDQKKIKLKLWPIYPFSIIRLVPDDNPRDAFWQENHKCFTLMCDPPIFITGKMFTAKKTVERTKGQLRMKKQVASRWHRSIVRVCTGTFWWISWFKFWNCRI